MSFSLDIEPTRSLANLEQYDVIEYESSHLDKDIYMVFSLETDDEIPALLLQLWKFKGGYDHAFANVMANDFGINQQVPYFEPKVEKGSILNITEYRPKKSGLSKKEEFFFDVFPESTTKVPDDTHSTPYKATISFANGERELILPSWTPLQRLPLDRIREGSVVEMWTVNSITNVMKVLDL